MNRVRLTISISPELASAIDQRVDGVVIRNRSHAIEHLISESLSLSSVKTAVVMAGGPDALDRIPAIKNALETLYSFGVNRIYIAVGYLGPKIEKALASSLPAGVKVVFHQSSQGTAGALHELKSHLARSFFVVNLKEPLTVDLTNLIRFHQEHKPVVTIATKNLRDLDGYYLLDPKVFGYIKKGFASLEDDTFAAISKEGKLLSYPLLG